MKDVLVKIDNILSSKNTDRKAEDILMYSTIVGNYVLYK